MLERMITSSELPRPPGPLDMFTMGGKTSLYDTVRRLPWLFMNLVDKDQESVELQKELVHVVGRDVLGLPPNIEGTVLTTGSEGNELALQLARDEGYGWEPSAPIPDPPRVLMTNLSHVSVRAACHKLHMVPEVLDVDPDTYQVAQEVFDDAHASAPEYNVAAVVSTRGTTQLGTVERIGSQSRTTPERLHTDAAFGWPDELRTPTVNSHSESFASLLVDVYKLVGVPGVSILFTKPGYLPKDGDTSYFNSFQSFRGTWRTAYNAKVALDMLHRLGRQGILLLREHCVEAAQNLAETVAQDGIQTLVPVESPIVPLRVDSENQMKFMHAALRTEEYLTSPIQITGRDPEGTKYARYGIRVVASPRKVVLDQFPKFAEVYRGCYREMKKEGIR